MKKSYCIDYPDVEIFYIGDAPYDIAVFGGEPQMQRIPLRLQGGTIDLDEKIACITSEKSSVVYEQLYPESPVRLIYKGVCPLMNGDFMVLWKMEIEGKEVSPGDEEHTYICNGYIKDECVLTFALPTSNGFGIRIIEGNKIYRHHSEVPQSLKEP